MHRARQIRRQAQVEVRLALAGHDRAEVEDGQRPRAVADQRVAERAVRDVADGDGRIDASRAVEQLGPVHVGEHDALDLRRRLLAVVPVREQRAAAHEAARQRLAQEARAAGDDDAHLVVALEFFL